MARITVEDCQQRVDNRFLLVQMAIKRVHQYREGYEPLVDSKNKEAVTALIEVNVVPQSADGFDRIAERICPKTAVSIPRWRKAPPPFWTTSLAGAAFP